jgi:hypothetical protein
MEQQPVVCPMTHGQMIWHTLHDPWRANILDTIVRSMTYGEGSPRPIVRPMTHGKIIPHAPWVIRHPHPHGSWVVRLGVRWRMAHDPWSFVTIVYSMTHGEKVTETCVRCGGRYVIFPMGRWWGCTSGPSLSSDEYRLIHRWHFENLQKQIEGYSVTNSPFWPCFWPSSFFFCTKFTRYSRSLCRETTKTSHKPNSSLIQKYYKERELYGLR